MNSNHVDWIKEQILVCLALFSHLLSIIIIESTREAIDKIEIVNIYLNYRPF